MTDIRVQLADKTDNETFQDLAGILSLTLSRASSSTPGSLDLYCAADHINDAQISPTTASRFNPKQQIQISFLDHTRGGAAFIVFMGRIDDAELIDDATDPNSKRRWHITARDWLSVLADNTVQSGKWRTVSLGNRGVPFAATDPYTPNYVGNYTGQFPNLPGEKRGTIIYDLCFNIVNNPENGLLGIVFNQYGNNSKHIEKNWESTSQISILDAIRELSQSDPWDDAATTTSGIDIALANFPATAGFGAELQILDMNVAASVHPLAYTGRVVEYYRWGLDTHSIFAYPPISNQGATNIITGYRFGKRGSDLFTRIRPTGQGDALFDTPDGGDGGRAVAFQIAETAWDPMRGLLKARSEGKTLSAAIVGDVAYAFQQLEPYAVKGRESYDASYAQIYAGAAALSNFRGGINQGRITTIGPPANSNGITTPITHLYRPGETVILQIPDLGIIDRYTVQTWTYRWPDDQTVFDMGRVPFTSSGKQIVDLQQRNNQSLTTMSKSYVSPWLISDPTGVMSVRHGLGTVPSTVTVEAAAWDGTSYNAGNQALGPIPIPPNSVVSVPSSALDGSQVQHYGYSLGTADSEIATVFFAYWIAYSGAAGKWLPRDDQYTIIRIKAYP